MGFYEKSLKSLEQRRLSLKGQWIYHKSIVSIMETIKNGLGNDHDGNSIYNKFDPVAVDNIIEYSNVYMKAYEKKISEIEQKIEKIKDKMENNSSTTEMIDALFAPMMEEYEQAEGKDIFDLLDELED